MDALEKSQAVIEFKPDGTILRANANFLGAVGYTLNEIKGQHHSMFMGEGEDGSKIWIQAIHNPIYDMNGRIDRVVKFATDITDRVTRNQQRDAAVKAIGCGTLKHCRDRDSVGSPANRHGVDNQGSRIRCGSSIPVSVHPGVPRSLLAS